jgi:hypothetical protein
VFNLRAGTLTPLVRLYARRYCANDSTGTVIGMTWRVFRAGRLIAVGQQSSTLKRDCTVDARLRFKVVKGTTYTATFALNAISGIELQRTLTIRGT